LLEGDVAVVFDVLLLLSVALWLVQCLDQQGGGSWHDFDLSLAVLNNQLHGNAKALESESLLSDVVGNLLGADRTELVVDGDIVNSHQAVVSTLGEPEHQYLVLALMRSA